MVHMMEQLKEKQIVLAIRLMLKSVDIIDISTFWVISLNRNKSTDGGEVYE